MGGGRYGSTWNVQKTKKTGDPPVAAAAAFAGPIREHPAAVGSEIWPKRSPHLAFLPGRRVCKDGGRNRLPRLKPDWPKNGSKRPNSGSTGLGEFFSGFGIRYPLWHSKLGLYRA